MHGYRGRRPRPASTSLTTTLILRYRDGFLNGRRVSDDVIDAKLSLVTNGQITSDFVSPHTGYPSQFPYLGRPQLTSRAD